ncbi:inositol monophosphatase family protein [uncultured Psychromonas sp.]|uniref:3'(2'),5'-bisphosphate nucleotidase CysQ family protein n=1 Tax=uncultured Psychromonas sp. TaxID=173974 RepID=UPI0026286BA6|nr:inositol monophosphatase family protein [uncultured Psychromonas sp.]
MLLTTEQLNQLSLLAIQAAEQAGDYIRQFDRALLTTHFKAAGSSQSAQVVTDVDFACQDIILTILQPICEQYDLALLSEEQVNEKKLSEDSTDLEAINLKSANQESREENTNIHPRLTKDYFWCIDPLDGTLPFIEGGNGYAVSIALVAASGEPILAAVHQPTSNTTYHTMIDTLGMTQGYKNKQPFNKSSPSDLSPNKPLPSESLLNQSLPSKLTESSTSDISSINTINKVNNSFTFYSDRSFQFSKHYPVLIKQLTILANELGYEKVIVKEQAGAVMNAMSVIECAVMEKQNPQHNAACYIKLPKPQLGGGSLWDFSATACLANATNTWVSDIHGNPLDLNRHDSNYMNHQGVLYASEQKLAQRLITMCRAFK